MNKINPYSVSYIAEQPTYADWEQRRYEIATAALQGLIAGGYQWWEAEEIARVAVKYADALIEELRKPRNESE